MTTHDEGYRDPDDVVDLDDAADAEPLPRELPGTPIEPGTPHHTYLVESAAATPEYLAQPHVSAALRSIQHWDELPNGFRHGVNTGEHEGIIFGWGYSDPVIPQYRPDFVREDVMTGKLRPKYRFLKGGGASTVLRSDPSDVDLVGRRAHIAEGPKQSLAVGSALMGTRDTVIGTPGCWGFRENKVVSPELTRLVKGSSEVIVYLDADAAHNRKVYDAGVALKKSLARKGRTVRFVQVPQIGENRHTGIDDYLATIPPERREEAVEDLIDAALDLPALERPAAKPVAGSPESFFTANNALKSAALADTLLNSREWIRDPDTGLILEYDDNEGIHVQWSADTCPVRSAMIDLLGNLYHDRHYSTVRNIVADRLRKAGLVPKPAPPGWLHVDNGWLHRASRQLHPHDPKWCSTTKLRVAFIAGATAPKIVKFLTKATLLADGIDQLDVLLDALSQLVTPDQLPEKAVFLIGEPRSGKGTTGGLVTAMYPDELVSACSLSDLATNRFAAADVHRAAVNVSGETEQSHIPDMSTFNKMFGKDKIPAEYKGVDRFKFYNRAPWIQMGNHLPVVSDVSGAVAARIQPIQFGESYVGREDRGLMDTLLPELSGFLNLLLDAAEARAERGNFLPPHPEVMDWFRAETNPVAEFVNECVEAAPEAVWTGRKTVPQEWLTTQQNLYKKYQSHCADVGRGALRRTRFADAIQKQPFSIKTAVTSGNIRGFACRLRTAAGNPFAAASTQTPVPGQRVVSWIDPTTGEVCVLLPGVTDISKAMRIPVPKTDGDDQQPPDADPWGGTSPDPEPDLSGPDTGGAEPEAEGVDEPATHGDAAEATEADPATDAPPEPEAVPADQDADEEPTETDSLSDPPPWRPRDLLAEAERIVRASAEVVDVATAHRILDAEREAGEWMGKDSEEENWTQRDRERRERRAALMAVRHLTVTQVADLMGIPPRRARSLLRRLVTLLEPDIHLRERPQKVDPFKFRAEPGAVEDTAFAVWTCPIPAPTTGGAQWPR